jgi:cytoskeletal protein CcmA (bactofilin family)|tara:strand:- start:544 stop:1002 length:459 start_codon:yes stop_codon:yes gene_type:complete
MFKNLRNNNIKNLNPNGRSLVGETLQIEGDIRSSGGVDVSGLVNGNVFVSNLVVNEEGSIRGSIEAVSIEINGHVEGKVLADTIIIGSKAVVKGDLIFRNTLKTEEGSDIDGYIKRVNNGKSNNDEDIAIEEIVDRQDRKPIRAVVQHKEAV